MRFSLTGIIRLLGFLAASACAVAITMARLEPEPWRSRLAGPPALGVVNGFVLDSNNRGSQFLDAETGRIVPMNLPTVDRIDYGSCSPWTDEEGEYQLVGRWECRDRGGPRSSSLAFGIARYAMPSGRVLDELPLEIPPASHPCWFPDRSARVLYTGCDGKLYRLDFEGTGEDSGSTPAPARVTWNIAPPGNYVLIRDPIWLDSAALDRRLIVSLAYRDGSGDDRLRPSRLWWLKLDEWGSTIIGAGPLAAEDGHSLGSTDDERFPNIAVQADGTLKIAWLAHRIPDWRWELRLATIRRDPVSGNPTIGPSETRTLSESPLPALPPFSADGRYLCALLGVPGSRKPPRVVRFATETPVELTVARHGTVDGG